MSLLETIRDVLSSVEGVVPKTELDNLMCEVLAAYWRAYRGESDGLL